MKVKSTFLIVVFFLLIITPLSAASEKVLGQAGNVTLYYLERFDEGGLNRSVDVFARNSNTRNMSVNVIYDNGFNNVRDLFAGWVIIPPGKTLFVGSIRQDDPNQYWGWHVKWQVSY